MTEPNTMTADQALRARVAELEREISARLDQRNLLRDEVRLLKKEVRQTQKAIKLVSEIPSS